MIRSRRFLGRGIELSLLRLIVLITASIFCGGCIPAEFTTRPGLSGTAIDSVTNRPVAGARVAIFMDHFDESATIPQPETTPIAQTTAAKDGSIYLAPESRWAILFAGMDFIEEPIRVTVEADGYRTCSSRYTFTEAPMALHRRIELGRINLEPDPSFNERADVTAE